MTIYFNSYGTEDQHRKSAESILRDLQVKGYHVFHATLDGENIVEFD